MIKVNISHEEWKYQATAEEQQTLDKLINDLLEPIMLDCMTYNASVNAVLTNDGNYKLSPKCDQYKTLMAMQSLLPEVIPNFS